MCGRRTSRSRAGRSLESSRTARASGRTSTRPCRSGKGTTSRSFRSWGYEDESDPKVVEKKIDAAVSHGVNVFVYDWYWYGGRPFLEDALNKGFLGASNNGKMKFFIMYANHHVCKLWDNKAADKEWDKPIWTGGVSEAEFPSLVARWIRQYFGRSNYYRIEGKPVLMIYELKTFIDGVGGREAAKRSLDHLRSECVKVGLGGVYLMVCDFAITRKDLDGLGIDGATIYNLVHCSISCEFGSADCDECDAAEV